MRVTLTPQAEELLRQALARSPGIKLPRHWPPRFKRVEPLRVQGELPSERLIRERR